MTARTKKMEPGINPNPDAHWNPSLKLKARFGFKPSPGRKQNRNLNKTLALALAFALADIAPPVQAVETLNTGALVSGTFGVLPSCLRFRVVGICVWLVCAGPYCKVETSVKYGHRNPDLVVGVTNGLGQNPWTEAKAIYSGLEASGASALVSAMGGSMHGGIGGIEAGTSGAPDRNESLGRKPNLSFREAQAVGHPLAGELYCPSATRFLSPHYLSGLDAVGWRWQLPEVAYPQALVPGFREVGNWPLNTWGSVYPRSGWLLQSDEPKAAAVAAQRVVDDARGRTPCLPRSRQRRGVRVRQQTGVAAPVTGGAQRQDRRLADAVARHGHELRNLRRERHRLRRRLVGGQAVRRRQNAWTLWRPYSCCEVKGVFLGYVDVLPYP